MTTPGLEGDWEELEAKRKLERRSAPSLQLIQIEDVPRIFYDFPPSLDQHLCLSNPIYAGFYANLPFCLIGIIPQHRSGVCGIWGWNTSLVDQHPYIYARWARRLIPRIQTLYPTIIGGCIPSKAKWLTSLGATISADGFTFTIEAPQ